MSLARLTLRVLRAVTLTAPRGCSRLLRLYDRALRYVNEAEDEAQADVNRRPMAFCANCQRETPHGYRANRRTCRICQWYSHDRSRFYHPPDEGVT